MTAATRTSSSLLSRCLFLGLVVVAAPHYYSYRLQTTRQINLATSLDVHLVSRRPLFPSSSTRVLLLHLPSKSYLITPLSRTLLSYSSRCSPVSEISTRRTWRNISFSRFRSLLR